MDRAIGQAILQGAIPTAVLGVAAASHCAVIPDVGKGIAAACRIVKEHHIRTESALTTKGERAEMHGRYTAINFVIEGLARAGTVDGVRITASGKAVVDGLSGRRVGQQPGLRVDAGIRVEYNGPARLKLFFASDAQARLLQVVGCDQKSMLKAVPVYERCAFIVVAIFR